MHRIYPPQQTRKKRKLAATKAANSRNAWFPGILTALYVVIVACLLAQHEVWRDEVRAWSITGSSPTFFALFKVLRNEGHPVGWYAVLYFGHLLWGSPLVLKLASLTAAAAAAYLVAAYSPFSAMEKILWLLGFYPLYEYSVQCRNYGLGMMLLFLFCAVYPQRKEKAVLPAVVLFLLSQTSLYGVILALALFVSRSVELLFLDRPAGHGRLPAFAAFAGICLSGICFAAWQMWPESTVLVTNIHQTTLADFAAALSSAFTDQGSFAHDAFSSPFPLIVPLLLTGIYLTLLRKPALLAYLFSAVIGMELAHRLVYSGAALRHQGFLFLAVFSVLWLDRFTEAQILKPSLWWEKIENKRSLLLRGGLFVLLLLQVYAGVKAVAKDIRYPMSSAGALASVLEAHPGLAQAIILTEPDYLAETLPYYLPNRIYLAREDRFGSVVSFTAVSRPLCTLGELLDKAGELSKQYGSEVLLLVPPGLEGNGSISMMYGREFRYSAGDIRRLSDETELVAVLDRALSDENYAVYRVKH